MPGDCRQSPSLDETVLDDLQAALGAARVHQLLGLFGDELESGVEAIRSALARRDQPAMLAETHSIGVASGSLGALRVRNAACDLQARIIEPIHNASLFAEAVSRLAAEVRGVRTAIDVHRRRTLVALSIA